jgi:hypothetical protein
MKFKEILKCFLKLVKGNVKPKDPTFSYKNEKLKEDPFRPYFKGATGTIDGSHVKVVVLADEVIEREICPSSISILF